MALWDQLNQRQSKDLTKAQLVELLYQARKRLLHAGEIIQAELALDDDDPDVEENLEFCQRIHIELSPEDA